MGYTHYMDMEGERKDFTEREWHTFKQLWSEVYPKLPKTVEHSGKTKPMAIHTYDKDNHVKFADDALGFFDSHDVAEEIMSFNGYNPDNHDEDWGYETFFIPKKSVHEGSNSHYCKTNERPYDFAVCVALGCLRMAVEEDGVISIRSDGELKDWEPALLFLKDNLESREIDAYGFTIEKRKLFIQSSKRTPSSNPIDDPIAWLMS